MAKGANHWVGIDFGSSYSCVSISRNGEIEVIADEQGSRTTPSYVAFTETDIIVGEAAVSQAHSNLQNTIFDIKCLIGQKFSDAKFQELIKKLPYKVLANDRDEPVVQVTLKGKTKTFTGEELVGFVLSKMKTTAENYLGGQVANAVIGVPMHFSEAQRQAIKKGAELSKFKQAHLINDCTAVAMSYNLDLAEAKAQTVLVVDFGGGSLDVSVVRSDHGVMTVVDHATDSSFGGSMVDDLLVDHFAKEFEKKNKGVKLLDGSGDRALQKLRTASEKAKRVLAAGPQGKIELDGLHDGRDFFTNISKARFEMMTSTFARKAMDVITSLLKQAGVDKSNVDKVLCVGGSTKLIKFRQALNDYFGAKVADSVNPDEAVTIGAALEASVLAVSCPEKLNGTIPSSSVTIGMEVSGGLSFPLIQRGAVLPASATKAFSLSEDNQTSVLIHLCQGDRVRASDNQRLASFVVSGIEPKPRGLSTIVVCVQMTETGSLKVVAKAKGGSNELQVAVTKDVPSEAALKKASAEASKYYEDDKQFASWAFMQEKVRQACRAAQNTSILAWLDSQKAATAADAVKLCAEAEEKLESLKATSKDEDDDEDEDDEGDEGDETESEEEDDYVLDDDLDD